MDVIAEGDSGFKKTKGLMNRNATLSHILREAKEREEQRFSSEVTTETERRAHYGLLFDEYQGLAHLEALEMLSKESEGKVRSIIGALSGEELVGLKQELEPLKEVLSMEEFDDDEEVEKADEEFIEEISAQFKELQISVRPEKLTNARKAIYDWMIKVEAEEKVTGEENKAEPQRKSTIEDYFPFSHPRFSIAIPAFRGAVLEKQKGTDAPIAVSGNGIGTEGLPCACLSPFCVRQKYNIASEKSDVLNPLITGVFLEVS
ncbi:Family with sequence similarity 114, partial [Pristimantis euphronides]